jgi:membrane protein DedA with SNARE-associated domain
MALETFLETYGLLAIFVLMLTKSAGVPIPIPGDVIMLAASARAAQGKLDLGQAFVALLVALVVGGVIQFALIQGPGRKLLYRYGRYLGLTPARLDAASGKVKQGGPLGIGLAILTPGIRSVTVAACGLAGLPLKTFVPGLVLGSALFLTLHFFLGYAGSSLLAVLPLPLIIALVLVGLAVWFAIRRWQRPRAKAGEIVSEAVEAWNEATCPLCLALGTTSRLINPAAKELITNKG